jgi:hypothetical protein
MKLTQRQLDVLNHVVEDGQAWADNTSEKNMFAKVARHESAYDEAVAKGNYLNRKQQEEADAVVAQERYDNASYDIKRRWEYPDIGDQLDALYHAGVFPEDMATKIKTVKDKYPKGNN